MRLSLRFIPPTILVFALAILYLTTLPEQEKLLPSPHWSFSGPFGTFDRASAQRGFEIYKEVCSNCHSLKQAYYRNLEGIGLSQAQVKAVAAGFTTPAIADDGSETTRPALPSDHFHAPFANDNAARAANNGALPPDQSVLEKAREGGATYIYSLLQGYSDPPPGVKVGEGLYLQQVFPRPSDRHAAAAVGWSGNLYRRHQEHAAAGSARHHDVPDLHRQPGDGAAQEDRSEDFCLSAADDGGDVWDKAEDLGGRALSGPASGAAGDCHKLLVRKAWP